MASRIGIFFTLIIGFLATYGQELTCGTQSSQRDINIIRSLRSLPVTGRVFSEDPIRIGITAHIVRESNSKGGLPKSKLDADLNALNKHFEDQNIEFFLFDEIKYINNSQYINFNFNQEPELIARYNVEQTVNIYFFQSIVLNGNNVCGYAYLPSAGFDHIMMDNDCVGNGSTLAHEVGHLLGLLHTHGVSNTVRTDELVNGTNCATAGDTFCDTPADPKLSGMVNNNCNYTGNEKDANGDFYAPDPKNLMSYSLNICRDKFSDEQKAIMNSAYYAYKSHIYKKNFAARFEVAKTEICIGNEVSFQNTSVGASSYLWTFEGGSPSTSTEENPVVTYNVEGTFSVSLEISEPEGNTFLKDEIDFIEVKNTGSSDILEKEGGFEEAELIEEVTKENLLQTFFLTDIASSEGSQSVSVNFFNSITKGDISYLNYASLNSTSNKYFELSFDYAYSGKDGDFDDGLGLAYRDPCGEWITVWEKIGADLRTTEPTFSFFVPREEEWKKQYYYFVIPEDIDVAEFAFKSTNGGGNALYIDNYSIKPTNLSFEIENVSITNSSCSDLEDGSVEVAMSRPGQFQYSLNGNEYSDQNVFDNLGAGLKEISVKNEIEEIKTITVDVMFENDYPAQPEIRVGENGLFVEVSENQTVQWYRNSQPLEGEISSELISPDRGSYTVGVSNGVCESLSNVFAVLSTKPIAQDVKLYPNPAHDFLNVTIPKSIGGEVESYVVRDVAGKIVLNSFNENRISVASLQSGLYILEINSKDFVISKRFLKR